ncbi:plasmid partitioning protein RepB [Rhizobium sp. SGZ-381]|uniref:plasmid partitioning protein RepB n=1 Tax=Rhizobium sp. SGZ-381 TaxID=3342800 RepID=UPI00366BCED9
MKGRDILKGMVGATDQKKPDANPQQVHRPAGAVRAMNMSLGRLNEEAAAAKVLRETLAQGDRVVELDPAQVEAAFIQDRIPVAVDVTLEALKASIRENGQQVPILVRPHPEKAKLYQAAYGHRRLRAAGELGLKVKAVIRQLSDQELILAQGQENGQRVDLSFIERALFARRMDDHGFDRETIAQALSVDKPEVSRLLQVAQAVPDAIILAIGPAPKIGRPRWLALADRLKVQASARKAAAMTGAEDFGAADSNDRFASLWAALNEAAPEQKMRASDEAVKTRKGIVLGTLSRSGKGAKLAIRSQAFADFMAERMPQLVAEFEKRDEGASDA